MERNELIQRLIAFLKKDPACAQAIGLLSGKAEIAIRVAQIEEVRVRNQGGSLEVDQNTRRPPDFTFDTTPEAVETLIQETNLNASQLAIKLTKQVVAKSIRFSMQCGIFSVTQKGYLKLLTLGGRDFLDELKKYELASVPKILSALKRIRS